MVDANAPSRQQIKENLLKQADEMFAAWDTHETVLEEAEKNFIAKQTFNDEGNAITLVKWRCDGATMEQMKPYIEDPTQIGTVIN